MPPSWPSRLLSGSSTPASSNNSNDLGQPSSSRTVSRSTPPVPSIPAPSQSRPHLGPPPSPTRTTPTSRQHAHNRSSSHPLPRIFGRKKSAGALKGQLDLDTPPDDALVLVLDGPVTESPTRNVSGKRRREDDANTTRHCMCCSTKCRFPRGLTVFRCTNCLTINDLTPHVPSEKSDRGVRDPEKGSNAQSNYQLGPKRA